MARRVFYSFHYVPDAWRASQVRNIGAIEGNRPITDNEWESITQGGDAAIERWIADQMSGRSCTVVLIGANTAYRKWITYEIEKTWRDGKGVVGVHIHNLKNHEGQQASKGMNPLDAVHVNGARLSNIAKAYDTPYTTSTFVYDHIKDNLDAWVEEAVRIRDSYL